MPQILLASVCLSRLMIIPYFLLIQCVYCVIWPPLTIDNEVALRSQRDISYNVSVDQLVDVGVRLSTVLLKEIHILNHT